MVVEIKIKSPQMLHLRAGALRYPHSVVDLPRAKFQGSKKTQGSERLVLLATTEDEAIAAVPEVDRAAVAAVQPQPAVVVSDAEDAEVTVGITDGLHANGEPLTSGLILILQTQLGTRLVGAELEAELESSHVDVPPSGAILETELGHRDVEEIELHLGVRRREGGLTEHAFRHGQFLSAPRWRSRGFLCCYPPWAWLSQKLCHSRKYPTNKTLFSMAKLASRYSKNWDALYYYKHCMSSNRAFQNSVTI